MTIGEEHLGGLVEEVTPGVQCRCVVVRPELLVTGCCALGIGCPWAGMSAGWQAGLCILDTPTCTLAMSPPLCPDMKLPRERKKKQDKPAA